MHHILLLEVDGSLEDRGMPLDLEEPLVQGGHAVVDAVLHRQEHERLTLVIAERGEQLR
jgi:hypothetical protein